MEGNALSSIHSPSLLTTDSCIGELNAIATENFVSFLGLVQLVIASFHLAGPFPWQPGVPTFLIPRFARGERRRGTGLSATAHGPGVSRVMIILCDDKPAAADERNCERSWEQD